MLIPIGHDQSTVRRMPWVTFAVMGICGLVFLAMLLRPGDQRVVAEAELRAVEYFLDHPYLELDPRLKTHVYYSLRQLERSSPEQPASRQAAADEQRELDRLTGEFLAARGRLPLRRWGLVPAEIEPVALITHQFVHAGWLHLLGNLFMLYLVGPALEDVWGRPLFAAFYLLSGVLAALAFTAGHPALDEPLVGASGAVAGVMGAFAVRFRSSRITFAYFVWMIRIYRGTFTAPAGLMLALWAIGELAFALKLWAFFSIADLGDVGFMAHVAGFVVGVGAALLVATLRIEERWVDPVVSRREVVHDSGSVEAWLAAADGGRVEEALRGLERMLDADPEDADAAAALWQLATRTGSPERAAPAVAATVRGAARRGDAAVVAQLWPELIAACPDVEVDVAVAARIVELLQAEGLDGVVESTLDWVVGRVGPASPVGPLIRLARVSRTLGRDDPFAELASASPDLDPASAAELQRLSGCSA